jgi:uncharacterized protein YebE (UPF0316 family)
MPLEAWMTDWIILPLVIFISRVIDVSLGTLRIILASRGNQKYAPLIGFFEILLWLIVARQVLSNMSNPASVLAYALGFSAGTYLGIKLENAFAFGDVLIRIVCKDTGSSIASSLRSFGYGVTQVNAEGKDGPVTILFSVIARKDIPEVEKRIHGLDRNAFYSIEDVRFLNSASKRWITQEARVQSAGRAK